MAQLGEQTCTNGQIIFASLLCYSGIHLKQLCQLMVFKRWLRKCEGKNTAGLRPAAIAPCALHGSQSILKPDCNALQCPIASQPLLTYQTSVSYR